MDAYVSKISPKMLKNTKSGLQIPLKGPSSKEKLKICGFQAQTTEKSDFVSKS